jgi:hypothetical protein
MVQTCEWPLLQEVSNNYPKFCVENLRSSLALKTVDGYYTEDSTRQPEKHRQEGECFGRAPLTTVVVVAERYSAPCPCTAAVLTIEPVDEGTEDSGPASGEDFTSLLA